VLLVNIAVYACLIRRAQASNQGWPT